MDSYPINWYPEPVPISLQTPTIYVPPSFAPYYPPTTVPYYPPTTAPYYPPSPVLYSPPLTSPPSTLPQNLETVLPAALQDCFAAMQQAFTEFNHEFTSGIRQIQDKLKERGVMLRQLQDSLPKSEVSATQANNSPRYAPDDSTLPSPWKGLIYGSSGLLYYWNPETSRTQYERPCNQASQCQVTLTGPSEPPTIVLEQSQVNPASPKATTDHTAILSGTTTGAALASGPELEHNLVGGNVVQPFTHPHPNPQHSSHKPTSQSPSIPTFVPQSTSPEPKPVSLPHKSFKHSRYRLVMAAKARVYKKTRNPHLHSGVGSYFRPKMNRRNWAVFKRDGVFLEIMQEIYELELRPSHVPATNQSSPPLISEVIAHKEVPHSKHSSALDQEPAKLHQPSYVAEVLSLANKSIVADPIHSSAPYTTYADVVFVVGGVVLQIRSKLAVMGGHELEPKAVNKYGPSTGSLICDEDNLCSKSTIVQQVTMKDDFYKLDFGLVYQFCKLGTFDKARGAFYDITKPWFEFVLIGNGILHGSIGGANFSGRDNYTKRQVNSVMVMEKIWHTSLASEGVKVDKVLVICSIVAQSKAELWQWLILCHFLPKRPTILHREAYDYMGESIPQVFTAWKWEWQATSSGILQLYHNYFIGKVGQEHWLSDEGVLKLNEDDNYLSENRSTSGIKLHNSLVATGLASHNDLIDMALFGYSEMVCQSSTLTGIGTSLSLMQVILSKVYKVEADEQTQTLVHRWLFCCSFLCECKMEVPILVDTLNMSVIGCVAGLLYGSLHTVLGSYHNMLALQVGLSLLLPLFSRASGKLLTMNITCKSLCKLKLVLGDYELIHDESHTLEDHEHSELVPQFHQLLLDAKHLYQFILCQFAISELMIPLDVSILPVRPHPISSLKSKSDLSTLRYYSDLLLAREYSVDFMTSTHWVCQYVEHLNKDILSLVNSPCITHVQAFPKPVDLLNHVREALELYEWFVRNHDTLMLGLTLGSCFVWYATLIYLTFSNDVDIWTAATFLPRSSSIAEVNTSLPTNVVFSSLIHRSGPVLLTAIDIPYVVHLYSHFGLLGMLAQNSATWIPPLIVKLNGLKVWVLSWHGLILRQAQIFTRDAFLIRELVFYKCSMFWLQTKVIMLETFYTGSYVQVASNYGVPFVFSHVEDTFHLVYPFWSRMLFHFAILDFIVGLRYWELSSVAASNLMIIDAEVSHSVFAMLCTGATYQSNFEQALLLRVSLLTCVVLFVLYPIAALVAHNSKDPMMRTMETFSGYSIQELNNYHLSSLAVIFHSLLLQIDELSSLVATHTPSVSMVLNTGLDVLASRLKTNLVGLSGFFMGLSVVHQSRGRWASHTPAILATTTTHAVYGCYKHYLDPYCANYGVYAADVPDQMLETTEASGMLLPEEIWAPLHLSTYARPEDMPCLKGGGMLGLLYCSYLIMWVNVYMGCFTILGSIIYPTRVQLSVGRFPCVELY